MLTVREAAAVVRELRQERGWTQNDLAERASVSRSFIAELETGKATVEAAKLLDVFQAFGFEFALRNRDTGVVRW